MVLKSEWERCNQSFDVTESFIKKVVFHAYPLTSLDAWELLPQGCRNINVKVKLKDDPDFFLLRIYFGHHKVSLVEKEVYELVAGDIPVPVVKCIGSTAGIHYAVMNFIEGLTLRDVILSEGVDAVSNVIYETGRILGKLQDYQLEITPQKEGFLEFAGKCLEDEMVAEILDYDVIVSIKRIFKDCTSYFSSVIKKSLVHGDYDPSNILVSRRKGEWGLAAVLDWEFCFSGSYLWDVANMLRYAHELPTSYQQYFIKGLSDAGIQLPLHWESMVSVYNLVSLLDCLKNSDACKTPKRIHDIVRQIKCIIAKILDFNMGNQSKHRPPGC